MHDFWTALLRLDHAIFSFPTCIDQNTNYYWLLYMQSIMHDV